MNATTESPMRAMTQRLRRGLLQVGLFSLFVNLIMLAPALYMLQVYDRVLAARSSETLLFLTLILGWMFLTLGVLEFVRSRMMVRLGSQLEQQLRQPVYQTVLRNAQADPANADAQPLADLNTLHQFLSGNGPFAFFDAPWIPVYLGVLWLIHPMLGGLAAIAALLLFSLALFNDLGTRRLQAHATQQQNAAARRFGAQLRNLEAVQAMGMQPALQQRWQELHQEAVRAQADAADRSGTWSNLGKTLRLAFQSLMLGVGAYLAIHGHITAGMVIAGSIILGRALAPIDQMIAGWRASTQARLAYRRLAELLQQPPQARRLSLPRPRGALQVERAVLLPPGASTPALRGISFSLEPGETLAILGNSAAGKSSLARAILGVWPLASGSVRLDGAELAQWNRDELGPALGYLPQDVELFEGTVAENIARFTDADSRAIVKAARVARVDGMIRELPQGYDTPIGPGGMALSGGQRQRIGLARALFGKPSLVVLDEPNANLDEEGEFALAKACRYLKSRGSTVLLISHRRNVLALADKVLVLDAGTQQLFGPREAVLQHLAAQTRLRPVPTPQRQYANA